MKTKEPWQLYATVFWVSELAAAGELQIVLKRNHQANVMTARMPIVVARRTLRRSFTPAPNYNLGDRMVALQLPQFCRITFLSPIPCFRQPRIRGRAAQRARPTAIGQRF